MKFFLAVAVLCVFAGSITANKIPKVIKLTPGQQSLAVGPENTALQVGETVILECAGTPGSGYRIQWTEYAYSPSGNLISDNNVILDHPQKARYQLIQTTPDTFNLQISNLALADGGTYVCQDINGYSPQFYRRFAQLIVIANQPNCTTTIPSNGQVIEGDYHSIECIMYYQGNIAPTMTITGPPPFRATSFNTTTSVWAGADLTVNRSMETGIFRLISNFTNNFYPVPVDSSAAIPTWTYTYQSSQMFINWKPTSMYATPMKDYYEIGDIITCNADAYPVATYGWQNMRTLGFIWGQGFLVQEDLDGTEQLMRCQASNIIFGTQYTGNFFMNMSVPARTTTQAPTQPPTTTPPPAVSSCFDLTGVWLASNPNAAKACFNVDYTNNGVVRGLYKNGTDTFLTELFGKVKTDSMAQIGFSGIGPSDNGLGASSFVGECHRCYGVETLLVKTISRQLGSNCLNEAGITISEEFTYSRASFNYVDCLST